MGLPEITLPARRGPRTNRPGLHSIMSLTARPVPANVGAASAPARRRRRRLGFGKVDDSGEAGAVDDDALSMRQAMENSGGFVFDFGTFGADRSDPAEAARNDFEAAFAG